MTKFNKIDESDMFMLIFAPIVAAILWYTSGYKLVIAVSVLFGALYSYYLLFLNIIFSIKEKKFSIYKNKIIIFLALSISIFSFSLIYYGLNFTLRPIVVIAVVSTTQAIIVLRR
jgi:hypothetical protein